MDDTNAGVGPASFSCPWCSARLASADEAVCPSCGATLAGDAEPQIPGLTTVVPPASARLARPPKRSRLLQWLSGEAAEESPAAVPAPGSLAPPPDEVRREIRRLELEARLTNLTAEASALAAQEALEAHAADDAAAAEAALEAARKLAADARVISDALAADALADDALPSDPSPGDPSPGDPRVEG